MQENLVTGKQNDTVVDKSKYNKSVSFVLPMLGHSVGFYYSLINSYLGDTDNRPSLNFKRIFVQNKYKDEKLRGIEYYDGEYTLDDGTYMYVYKIPEQFAQDFDLFCQGKYSEFSKQYKDQICRLVNVKPVVNSNMYKILYKTADRKKFIEDLVGQSIGDQEVCSVPDLNREIYSTKGIELHEL